MSEVALYLGCGLFLLFLTFAYFYFRKGPQDSFGEWGFRTHTLKVDGIDFHYFSEGEGPTLLLLHGIGANLLCWRQIWPLLTPHFYVIALDLPGFGRSQPDIVGRYGLDEQVERIQKFLSALGIHEMHVVGNSMGANIALWLAARDPNLVMSVCCIAPATHHRLVPLALGPWTWLARPASYMIPRRVMKWAHQRTVSKPELVDDLRLNETWRTYGRNSMAIKNFMLATDAIRDRRLLKGLGSISDEVLILWGKSDRLVPYRVIEQLHSTLKKSTVKIHQSGGHHLQEDEPEWVARQIFTFLGPKQS